MIRVKAGVSLRGVQPQAFFACSVAEGIWAQYGAHTLWITSGTDGVHKVGSKHYEGLAVDLRITSLPRSTWETVTAMLRSALGAEYDVLLELDPPHVHAEFDPK